jgi:hypothetical protein
MTNLAQERDLTKLPKWAQEYFADIRRQRDAAVLALNEFRDSETPSNFWVETWVSDGEETSPSTKRHYIQTHRVTVRVDKREVDILLRQDGELEISAGFGGLRVQPIAYNAIRIEKSK